MSALAVEAPTTAPEWAGRLVVRAAGRPVLHIAANGTTAPSVPVFTVPLECVPDAERAPGVRPWAGPVTESGICPACLRSLRGQPEPEALGAADVHVARPERRAVRGPADARPRRLPAGLRHQAGAAALRPPAVQRAPRLGRQPERDPPVGDGGHPRREVPGWEDEQ